MGSRPHLPGLFEALLEATQTEVAVDNGDEGSAVATLTLHRPIQQGCLLQADFGLSLDSGVQDPEELRDEALATRWREERELLPQEFLRQALENPGSLCFLGTHGSRDVLQYEAGNAGRRALFLDSSTHLLQRVESFAHWDSKGDRLEWIEFSAYQPFDGIQIGVAGSSVIRQQRK